MFQDIVLLHKNHQSQPFDEAQLGDPWVSFDTCLRKIRFGHLSWLNSAYKEELQKTREIYVGFDAFKFCLEVVCGLHSPMVGETEVLGQFREMAFKSEPHNFTNLNKFFNTVLSDAKMIRHHYLTNLGSQTYGSLTRRYLESFQNVAILGAGQLAQEIAPWLKRKESIFVYARDVQKSLQWTSQFKNISSQKFDPNVPLPSTIEALVISAPVDKKTIEGWTQHPVQLVIDLRGDAEDDQLLLPHSRVIGLNEFFQTIQSNKLKIEDQLLKAKSKILKLTKERARSVEIRPFGWDDLCA